MCTERRWVIGFNCLWLEEARSKEGNPFEKCKTGGRQDGAGGVEKVWMAEDELKKGFMACAIGSSL